MSEMKISFIGGASMTWTPTFSQEILSCEDLAGSTIMLMDPDTERLEVMERYMERVRREMNADATIITTRERDEALEEADVVVITFMAGGHNYWATDLNIALKYGLQTPKGMSVGPGGLLQGLKAIPMIVEIAQEMERQCPRAALINYTNPMSSIVLGLQRYSTTPSVGVCTGPDHEKARYAALLGVPVEELHIRAAGVNHCDFILEMRHGGRDVLPQLVEMLAQRGEDPISRLIYDIFGALPMPEDIHIMEFFPYFMRQGVKLEQWNQTHNFVENRMAKRAVFWEQLEAAARDEGPLVTSYEAHEKLDQLVSSVVFNQPRVFQLNVTNGSAIPNILPNAVVELPVAVHAFGFQALQFGPVPPGVAGVCNMAATVQDLTVEAAMQGDRDLALQALLMDPLVYSMDMRQAGQMLDEMLAAQRVWLPRFFN
jgi:alpha-galactosidase